MTTHLKRATRALSTAVASETISSGEGGWKKDDNGDVMPPE